MAHQATGAVVAKKFAHAYEESERLAAELSMFERENGMLRDEIERSLPVLAVAIMCCRHLSLMTRCMLWHISHHMFAGSRSCGAMHSRYSCLHPVRPNNTQILCRGGCSFAVLTVAQE